MTSGAISSAITCATCHVTPTDALSTGHLNGSTATVSWSGLATATAASPTWNRATGSCAATYCHGNYQGTYTYGTWDWGCDCPGPNVTVQYRGTGAAVNWAGGAMACTSCHANPPATGNWHSGSHATPLPDGNDCSTCHPHVNAAGTAILNPSLHVNGTVEVTPAWRPACFNCH